MGIYQMKAIILMYVDRNNINYMNELRHKLKQEECYDLLILLDEDREFSDKIKNFLFRKRLGVVSHE